jgi:energy-coupling factor transporter ATP-binding protein EcfA2
MKLSYFEIENFKGISSIRLDFDSHPRSNVYTLIGLNESGKTTILEALNFLAGGAALDPLNLQGYSIKDVHDLIPIGSRANFNDNIVIRAGYELDDEDNEAIADHLWTFLRFDLKQKLEKVVLTRSYGFKDSKLIEGPPNTLWNAPFIGRLRRAKTERRLEGDDWLTAIKYLRTLLPSVLYFPNFLFEFPDRIYLEEIEVDDEKHRLYRTILQDVLDSIGDATNLSTHVLARAKAGTKHDRQALDIVLLKMGVNISKTVFENWNRIFKHTAGNREIVVNYDQDEQGKWYLQLRLKDGSELYAISERSLGFRWFFAFLLLTQYRGFRKNAPKNVLFLFDEPASNLHSSAQTQLLESFGRLAEKCSIMYTTHSHYMINPAWLEGAYVVKNEGLDYNFEDEYKAKNTNITLHKYRQFVAHHPNQTTYFQPVLDVLDYSPGKLENVPKVVMLEGKNDYYTLKYIQEKVLNITKGINLMPGGGAGSLDGAIRLYLAWGRQFVVLLDSDKGGTKEKQRYEDLFGALVQDRIFSLEDINSRWKKTQMELVLEEADRKKIQQTVYKSPTDYNKKDFNRAIQELYLTDQRLKLTARTTARFTKILEFCSQRLKDSN